MGRSSLSRGVNDAGRHAPKSLKESPFERIQIVGVIHLSEPIDLKQIRQETGKAQALLKPEEVKDHEKNLLRGVFEAWPEIVDGACEVLNELFKQQVIIAQAADPTPYRVKAVRSDALRAAVDEKGAEALNELLRRIDLNDREILRRVKAVRAERDAFQAERDAARAELAALKGAAPPADQ